MHTLGHWPQLCSALSEATHFVMQSDSGEGSPSQRVSPDVATLSLYGQQVSVHSRFPNCESAVLHQKVMHTGAPQKRRYLLGDGKALLARRPLNKRMHDTVLKQYVQGILKHNDFHAGAGLSITELMEKAQQTWNQHCQENKISVRSSPGAGPQSRRFDAFVLQHFPGFQSAFTFTNARRLCVCIGQQIFHVWAHNLCRIGGFLTDPRVEWSRGGFSSSI